MESITFSNVLLKHTKMAQFILHINKNTRSYNDMVIIYVTLIIKGKRTYKSVPVKLKNEVREVLISLEVNI